MKTTLSQTEMLRDMEHLDWFVHWALFRLLVNDEINVYVSVNKIPVCGSSHGTLSNNKINLFINSFIVLYDWSSLSQFDQKCGNNGIIRNKFILRNIFIIKMWTLILHPTPLPLHHYRSSIEWRALFLNINLENGKKL